MAIGVAGAAQFNRLMRQAQHALPASQAVCHLLPLTQSDTIREAAGAAHSPQDGFPDGDDAELAQTFALKAQIAVASVTLVARPPRLLV